MAFLNDDQKQQLRAAIRAAETKTSGEIVTVIAAESGSYFYYPTLWAALLAILAPLPFAFLSTTFAPLGIVELQLLAFALLALAYRPWSVTKLFWEITPPDKRIFVADPSVGSKHNRGCAVDIGLFELETGRIVEMPGAYDEMTERSFVTYTGGTADQRAGRDLLRQAMERDGYFFVYPEEWWHYDFKDFREYAIENVPSAAINPP